MFKYILVTLFISGTFCVFSQSEQINKATNQQFSLNPNHIGALSNSVNLFTGQIGFPMTIASLSGRGGLNPQVVINYSSAGIEQQVKTWNRDAPTSVLGLGWSFDHPKIICEFNGTATRHDDVFYILDNGTSTKLICTEDDKDGSNLYRTYVTQSYTNWTIRYYYQDEKWEVLQDNGMKWTYGDSGRNRSEGTIQYMITWDNWVGSSSQTINQEELAYVWNLSEVQNLWNDKMTYFYSNVEESVGSGALKHTKASYLSRIESPTGNAIKINYEEKKYESCIDGSYRCPDKIKEYQDPHEEKQSEPDAYQEKYQTRYMSNVEAFDEDANLLYTVNLSYGQTEDDDTEDSVWVGGGDKAKRILTSIQKTNSNGQSLPKTEFKYNDNGDFDGYLDQVSNTTGAVITYQYTKTGFKTKIIESGSIDLELPIRVGRRNINIKSPSQEFMAPSLFYGKDYVVVLWRDVEKINPVTNRPYYNTDKVASYIQVYQWEGEWVKYDLGLLDLVVGNYDGKVGKAITAKITLQDDFFAIAGKVGESHNGQIPKVYRDDYHMEIFTKDRASSEWSHYRNESFETSDAYDYAIEHHLWSGKDYIAFGTVSEPIHYVFDWDGKEFSQRDIRNYEGHTDHSFSNANNWYIMQDNNVEINNRDAIYFQYKSEDGDWVDKGLLPLHIRWNSNGDDGDPDGTDRSFWYPTPAFAFVSADHYGPRVISWDRNYENFKSYENFSKTSRNSLPIFVNPFMIGIDRGGSFLLNRFDGLNWTEYKEAKGVDEETLTAQLSESHALIYHDVLKIGGKIKTGTSLHNLIMQMDGDIGAWEEGPKVDFSESFEMYNDYAIMGSSAYGREPDGSWVSLGLPSISFSAYDRAKDIHSGAGCMFLWDKNGSKGTYIGQIKNGEIHWSKETYPMRNYQAPYGYANLIGGREFAIFDKQNEHWKVQNLKLFRNSANEIRGGHKAVIVKQLNVDDGYLQLSRQYEYNEETARMAINGNYPLFNEVKVTNGGEDASEQELGYTVSYFYNGKSLDDLAKIPLDQDDSFDDLLLGSSYLNEHFNKDGQLVQSTEKIFETIHAGDVRIDMVRQTENRQSTYETSGTNSVYSRTTYNNLGLPVETESDNFSSEVGDANNTHVRTTYLYHPTQYGNSFNLQMEAIATSTFTGEAGNYLLSKRVNIWEEVNGIPRVTRSYALRKPNVNSSNFSWWNNPSYIPSTWRLAIKNNQWDAYGNVLETEDFRGDKSATIYNDYGNRVIASASFAGYSDVAFTSFEENQSGRWSFSSADVVQDGFTGSQALSGNFASGQLMGGDYTLYFWYKDGSPSITITSGSISDENDIDSRQGWTLREVNFTIISSGWVSFTANGAKVDEVRVHPDDADMSTMVYDERYRVVAETDANMITTFYEYDLLDRRNVVRDMDGVIRTFYTYGFKKEQ